MTSSGDQPYPTPPTTATPVRPERRRTSGRRLLVLLGIGAVAIAGAGTALVLSPDVPEPTNYNDTRTLATAVHTQLNQRLRTPRIPEPVDDVVCGRDGDNDFRCRVHFIGNEFLGPHTMVMTVTVYDHDHHWRGSFDDTLSKI